MQEIFKDFCIKIVNLKIAHSTFLSRNIAFKECEGLKYTLLKDTESQRNW
jgi:hypothetical protein